MEAKIYSNTPPDGSIFEILFTNYYFTWDSGNRKSITKLQRLFYEDFKLLRNMI